MPTRTREHVIQIDDPSAGGLYESLESGAQISNPVFFRGSDEYIGWRFAKAAAPGSANQLEQVAPPNAVKVSIYAAADSAPTSGTATLEYGGQEFVMTAGMTEADASSAIQGATAITDESVTVAKEGEVDYVVTFGPLGVPASVFTVTGNDLRPDSSVSVKKIITGDADTREVWRITISQKGLAFAVPVTPYAVLDDPVEPDFTVTGSATAFCVQRIVFSPLPYSGTAQWNGRVPQLTSVTAVADVAGTLNNKVICTLRDASGPVQIYLSKGGGSPPTTPVGGRDIVVSYIEGDNAAAIARAIWEELSTDAEVSTISLSGSTVVISSFESGFTAGNSGSTVAVTREQELVQALIPWGVALTEIEAAFQDLWTIGSPTEGTFVFTANEKGIQYPISVDTEDLLVPLGLEGTLSTDTLAAIQAFAATTEDEIACIYEIEATESGGSPRTILQVPCTEKRDNIRTA